MTTSDMLEDDQLSILLMKNGEKVVTGTQSGVLNIWSWGKVQNFFVLFLTRQVGQHVKGKQLITVINDGSLRKLLHTKKLNST